MTAPRVCSVLYGFQNPPCGLSHCVLQPPHAGSPTRGLFRIGEGRRVLGQLRSPHLLVCQISPREAVFSGHCCSLHTNLKQGKGGSVSCRERPWAARILGSASHSLLSPAAFTSYALRRGPPHLPILSEGFPSFSVSQIFTHRPSCFWVPLPTCCMQGLGWMCLTDLQFLTTSPALCSPRLLPPLCQV